MERDNHNRKPENNIAKYEWENENLQKLVILFKAWRSQLFFLRRKIFKKWVLYLLCLIRSLYFCCFTLCVHISSNFFSFFTLLREQFSWNCFFWRRFTPLKWSCYLLHAPKKVCKLCIYVSKTEEKTLKIYYNEKKTNLKNFLARYCIP